jgi:hypothetical protein
MAQLRQTSVTGSLIISGSILSLPSFTNAQTSSFTGSVGNVWFNSNTGCISYTYNTGGGIGVCSV